MVTRQTAWRALTGLAVTGFLAGCSGGPPDQPAGPVEPRNARLDDTTAIVLPAATSPEFCEAAQQILASTTLTGSNTVFTDMPAYRASKPAVNPHRIYQVVTYGGTRPVAVSCKVKTAAHLRAMYGPEAAGAQHNCADLTRRTRDRVAAELEAEGLAAAARRAAAFVIEDNEPYVTGQAYLGDFPLSFVGDDGAIHLNSPGLFQDYDSWITRFLPWQVQGQHYCHLATAEYIRALATEELAPGLVITSADDAPVTPR